MFYSGRFTVHITAKKILLPRYWRASISKTHVTGVAVTAKRDHQLIVSLASSSAEHQNAGSSGGCSHTPLASAQHREG